MTHINRRRFLSTAAGFVASLPFLDKLAMAQGQELNKNLIIVFVRGGWDISHALDPHRDNPNVDSPDGEVNVYANIPILTHPSRPSVGRFFADFASMSAVVNGVAVQSVAHPECTTRILTGTTRESNPDLGAIVGHTTGSDLPVPYFILGNAAFTGPLSGSTGRAGITNQIVALLDERSAYPIASPHRGFAPSDDEQALVRRFLDARTETLRAERGQLGSNKTRLDDYTISLERADLLSSFRDSFGGRGVQLSLDQQLGLAVEMMSGGVCRSIITEDRQPWDTHQNNALQSDNYENLFAALSNLATRLDRAHLLDKTVVAVISEMSRTPKLNDQMGKDHWPYTSALVFGAGVRGGEVIGATSPLVEGIKVNLDTGAPDDAGTVIHAENLIAGLINLLGADASVWLPRSTPLRALQA